MNQELLKEITKDQLKAGRDKFKVGDSVSVHTKVKEGDKERIQVFSGIVISRQGGGIAETFVVRRVSAGEGVEKTFPVHSPNIEKVVVDRDSVVLKSAKMFYIRDRIGKEATKVKEKRFVLKK